MTLLPVAPELAPCGHDHEVALALDQIRDLQAQAVAHRATIDNLTIALATARQIGAALGIVMAALKVTEDMAFEVLKAASQNSNRKLRDIADDVVSTGAIPMAVDSERTPGP